MTSIDSSNAVEEVWGSSVEQIDVLGYPCSSFVKRRRHLGDLLLDGRRFGEREYLVHGDRRLSFDAHEAAVKRVAALLQERDVRAGDRIMLFGANSIEWVVSYWAIMELGGIVVLGNAWWSQGEVDHALRTVSPALVITDVPRSQMIGLVQAKVGFDVIAAAIADLEPTATYVRPVMKEDDPAVVLFTSGTTGLPKGAVLSHRGILATLQSLALLTRRLPNSGAELPRSSKAMLSIPLFHVGGLQQIITPMLAGGTLVFTEGRFDPATVVRLIEDENITVWSTVPTMVSRVMDHLEEVNHAPLPMLRTVGLGGSPVGMQLRSRVPRWFPNASRGVAVTYGLSEAGGVLATGVGDELLNRPGTVGKPLKIVTVRIDDPDENGHGEIMVRSPSVMLRYWSNGDDRAANDPITADRWLRTGDVGWLDDDGYLYVTDRSKDIVIRGGENIATPHVENRLLEHPDVREAAVVGLPHPHLGEEVGAILVLDKGSQVSIDELATFAREKLAYFEVPTRWQLRESSLPQNATGKVIKRVLRDEWAAQIVT
ncbi:class I adenylate-forming enzyme family protein [Rhodococcus globerulus]|uniref:Class I adenylate-forming enzyme family protein n=1 Tax=Rhodococcus globerulus TaxID=33008 RepID=A0ABU4C4K3_RHOGO|nr:class I adenylate-forming enzyme family protein [Rhodococcus globerulus]MDV6271148.1 class I adenylate-forming enzyme family protein [Rhodococcus globerulus]